MIEYTYQADKMGTTASLSIICPDQTLADQLSTTAFLEIDRYEQCFSRFKEDSELSTLNRNKTAAVSEVFWGVFKLSQDLYQLTAGTFNPLVQVSALGYHTSFKDLPPITTETNTDYDQDFLAIKSDPHTRQITLNAKQNLDFGGIVKGYLATLLAEKIITQPLCTGVIVNLGGDIATRGKDADNKPFIFALYNPVTDTEDFVSLTDRALTTSGTYKRRWQTAEGTRHHIVDPKTKDNPHTDLVTASISHPDGATAEALSKTMLVLGTAKTIALLPPDIHNYQYYCVNDNGIMESNFNFTS